MKKTLIALATALTLTIGLVGTAGAADRPTREGEPWWVTGGHVTVVPGNACNGGPFGDSREYGRPQPGR